MLMLSLYRVMWNKGVQQLKVLNCSQLIDTSISTDYHGVHECL